MQFHKVETSKIHFTFGKKAEQNNLYMNYHIQTLHCISDTDYADCEHV